MNSENFAKLIPLGSHLCREPMPSMAELKRDMENLKKRGFNFIKIQEHWQTDEPAEGKYDFSRCAELIAHAAKLDLGVYLGLTCEQAPNWLWDKHPSCRMVGRNGLPIAYQAQSPWPGDGKPGPCYDHPGALEDKKRFIRQLVKTLGRYENIVIWNTWQEIWYQSDYIIGQPVCYCEHTIVHFRQWLKEKHGDLDALNRAWNTRYAAWEQVLPERCNRTLSEAVEIEWQYFMDNIQIGRILLVRAQVIRETDDMHRPIFAHKGAPVIGSGHDWTYARCQDFHGASCYPAGGFGDRWDDGAERTPTREDALRTEMWRGVALTFDYIRSANPAGSPIWAAEFQGGPLCSGFFYKGRVPSPEDIRRWMLTAVGSGVTAISFWVTRAEIMARECNGFSLLDSVGDTTPRFEEAAWVGRVLNRHPELFGRATLPQAPVAILVNERNYQYCVSTGQGGAHLAYSVRGWHRMLWDAGISVDFVEAIELDDPRILNYKAIIMPFQLALSEEVVGKLARYVESGGNLISEACPGRINDYAFCNRGELSPAMAELFGVRHETLTMVCEPEGGRRWTPPDRTWGEYLEATMLEGAGPLAGNKIRANLYVETYIPENSSVCLRYGKAAAGVVREFGGGKAWLLGTFVGHSGTAYRDAAVNECVLKIVRDAGVKPEHEGKLLLRKRKTAEKEAWIFTNNSSCDIEEEIDLKGWNSVEDLLDGPLSVKAGRVKIKVKSMEVKALILSNPAE